VANSKPTTELLYNKVLLVSVYLLFAEDD